MSATTERKAEESLNEELNEIYTPGIPITNPGLFSGREALLKDLRVQLGIRGRVVILYGDRGVGKTSFCNVLLHDKRVVTYRCTPKDNLLSIFSNILKRYQAHLTEAETTEAGEVGAELGITGVKASVTESVSRTFKPIANATFDQDEIVLRLEAIQGQLDAIVFDEAQRLEDKEVHEQLESLLKALSDQSISINIVFVGIADSDETLLPPSPSYKEYKVRHYTTRRIPPMSELEIRDIIERRQNLFKIRFDEESLGSLAKVAAGYPSIAHSLALYSCIAWLGKNAGALLSKWASGFVFLRDLFGLDEIKVEKIDMRVTDADFLAGVRMFLSEIYQNYNEPSQQLKKAFASSQGDDARKLLSLLAAEGQRNGLPAIELASELQSDSESLTEIVSSRLHKVVVAVPGNPDSWKLDVPQFSAVVRALTLFRDKDPGYFAE